MKRILIINVNWLGDTIFVTPFIRAVRDNLPGSYIAVLTHPRCAEILEGNPRINDIIIYDERKSHRGLFPKLSLISTLRHKGFDTAFILRRSFSRTMLAFLSGIPDRIGYSNRKTDFLLTRRIPLPAKDVHRIEYFLEIARAVGIQPKNTDCEFFVSDTDRKRAREILEQAGISGKEEFIAINPGGNWDLKRWPSENFARLGDEILMRSDKKVVLTGSDKDVVLCGKIADMMKQKPVLLCGKTDLKTLGAVFEKAALVVSNDSGPLHIAAGVKTPVVALFGPTSPFITGPHGGAEAKVVQKEVDCEIPCYKLSCRDNRCMKAITVEDVLKAIQ